MDHWAIVRAAWTATRRDRGLWGFGAIAAAQSTITTFMAGLFGALFAMWMMLLETIALADSPSSEQFFSTVGEASVIVDEFVTANAGAIVAAAVAVWLVWLAIAAIDVASVGGLVAESDAAAQGEAASFGRGLAVGWHHWWRVAGLYAIQMLPLLVMMAVMALLMWVPLLGPTLSGSMPVPGQAMAVAQSIQPLGSVSSLIALPLGVIILFALRFAVIQDMDWRSAFSASWSLVRANAGTVALFFLVMWGVGILASAVMGAITVVATMLQIIAVTAGIAADALAPGVVFAVLVALVEVFGLFVVAAATAVLAANAYTLVWRELIARPLAEKLEPASSPLSQAPISAPLDGVPPAAPAYEGESS